MPITAYFAEGVTKKRQKRPTSATARGKVTDFLGSKDEDLSEAVLEMLPTETASTARVHSKYWTKDWANYAASYDIEDLVAANNACVARALSMGVVAKELVLGLWKKNEDLERRMEASSNWEAEVEKARKELEEKWISTSSKLDSVEIEANRLRHELHESVSHVAALTKKVDQANDHQKLTSEALQEANKERAELRKLTEGQAGR